jgi:hypothetical protein
MPCSDNLGTIVTGEQAQSAVKLRSQVKCCPLAAHLRNCNEQCVDGNIFLMWNVTGGLLETKEEKCLSKEHHALTMK